MRRRHAEGPLFEVGDRCTWYCQREGTNGRRVRIPVEVLKVYPVKSRVREILTGRETVVRTENLMP